MKCQCIDCSNGNPSNTYSEQHRHECEVREIAKKPGINIKEYLDGIQTKRGYAAYKKLRDDVEIEYRRIRSAK